MESRIPERGSTHVYNVSKISKEEIERMVERCVYEQPPFCNAACPLKLDTRAMLGAVASGNFKKALQLYEKIAPFPLILSQGCEAPCEGTCRLGECGEGVAVRAIEMAVARCGEAPLDAPHPAVLNAIYAATGARVTRIPATPDKVLAALKELE